MKELHIHEVLRMMIEKQKTYVDKADFIKDINNEFGTDVCFHACSDGGMDADQAFDFLIRRGKISLNNQDNVAIDPGMTMCDENADHDHDHDHH